MATHAFAKQTFQPETLIISNIDHTALILSSKFFLNSFKLLKNCSTFLKNKKKLKHKTFKNVALLKRNPKEFTFSTKPRFTFKSLKPYFKVK